MGHKFVALAVATGLWTVAGYISSPVLTAPASSDLSRERPLLAASENGGRRPLLAASENGGRRPLLAASENGGRRPLSATLLV